MEFAVARFTIYVMACLLFVSVSPTAEEQACDVCHCRKLGGGLIVNCTNKGLTDLPRAIPINTTVLLLDDNAIKDIPYDSLMNLKSLLTLNIGNNNISKPFELPESVQNIYAINNSLQSIKPILTNGINLTAVFFRGNKLQVVETDTCVRCKKLMSLDLYNNMITEIQPRGLAGPQSPYANLNLGGNQIRELGPSNLDGLNCLILSFKDNAIKRIKSYTFGSLSHIGDLWLQKNEIEEVPTGLFLHLVERHRDKALHRLLLSNNKIRRIAPGAFDGVTTFGALILAMNELQSLPEDMLTNITITETLDISSNGLTRLSDTFLRNQTKLSALLISRNRISVLNNKMFQGLHSLKDLVIFGNPIVQVEDGMLSDTQLVRLLMFLNQLDSTGVGARPFATRNSTIKLVALYGTNGLDAISNEAWQDLATGCYVSVSNILKFAPVTNRTDLTIELVGDGFAQPIDLNMNEAQIMKQSGFQCEKTSWKWQCTPCPQGTYGARWFENCKNCPPGGFYQMKTGQVAVKEEGINCQHCNVGTYVTVANHPGTNPKDCTVCPTGTNKSLHAGFRAGPCLSHHYRKDRFGECMPCPINGINCSGEYQHIMPGFWWTWNWSTFHNYQSYEQFVQNLLTESEDYNTNTQTFSGVLPKVHKCPHKQFCVNDGDGINASCLQGYEGWLCSDCAKNYYSWLDYCFECPEWYLFLLEILVIAAVLVLIILIISWDLRRHRRGGRRAVDVIFARGKILLGFYQVMGEIFSSVNEISWPAVLSNFGRFVNFLEVNIMRLLISPRCYFPNFTFPNIYIEFIFGISFVVAVVLLALCFYAFKKCYLTVKMPSLKERQNSLSQTKEKCYLFAVLMIFISYPSLSNVILSLLPTGCETFFQDENETEALQASRLRFDYSVNCTTEQHVHFNYAAEVAVAYVIGFPAILYVLLWGSRRKPNLSSECVDERSGNDIRVSPAIRQLDDQQSEDTANGRDAAPIQTENSSLPLLRTTSDRTSPGNISWESFLCENYKEQFWYWEIVELARKVLQTLFVLLFGAEDHFSLFASIVLSVGFLVLHGYAKPMKDTAEHRLQMCSLAAIFLNLSAASLLLLPIAGDKSSKGRMDGLALFLVLLNLSIIVFVVGSLLWTGTKALYNLGFFRCPRLRGCVMFARYQYGTQRNANGYQSSDQDPTMATDEEDSRLIDITEYDHRDDSSEDDHLDDVTEDDHPDDVTEDDHDDVTENDHLIDLT